MPSREASLTRPRASPDNRLQARRRPAQRRRATAPPERLRGHPRRRLGTRAYDPERLDAMLARLKLTVIRERLARLLEEAARGELNVREALAHLCEAEIAPHASLPPPPPLVAAAVSQAAIATAGSA